MIERQKIKRNFIPGEEWIYYKIYCGTYSADRILIEFICATANALLNRKLISHWFFIRYNDPDNHLRVRFHSADLEKVLEIISLMAECLNELMEKQLVHDIALGVYKREIERYGENCIELVEQLFFFNSRKTIKLIRAIEPSQDEITRIFASIQTIDELLDFFRIPLDKKMLFAKKMEESYKKEIEINSTNNKNLSDLYRVNKNSIAMLLKKKQDPPNMPGLVKIMELRKKEIQALRIIAEKTTVSLDNLIASIIHMNVNRMFKSNQRHYEMLCYDFMSRYYKSEVARK